MAQQTISKMETLQTAVEWLTQQVKSKEWQDMYIWHKEEIFKQANQMEKEQMKGMYVEGVFAQMRYFDGKEFITGEQYYKDTYK